MKIALITLFPEMFDALTEYGVSGRAVNKGLLKFLALTQEILPRMLIQQLMIVPMVVGLAWFFN